MLSGPRLLPTMMLQNQLENRSARQINNGVHLISYFLQPEPGLNSDTSTTSSSWCNTLSAATPPDVEMQGAALSTKSFWHRRPSSCELSLSASLGRPCGMIYTPLCLGTPNIIATLIMGNTTSIVEEQIIERLISPAIVVDPSVDKSCSVAMPDSNGQTVMEVHTSPVANILLDPLDEVQALLDVKQSQSPVNLIISKDSTLLPFMLKEQYGCLFLGLFTVNDIKVSFALIFGGFNNTNTNVISVNRPEVLRREQQCKVHHSLDFYI